MRDERTKVLDALDDIVMAAPEPGSVLGQLLDQDVESDLAHVLGSLVIHSTQFLRAAMHTLELARRGKLTAWGVAPPARSGLLGLSKAIVISSALCRETRALGPALQHKHDSRIDTFLEQDRNAKFDPEAQSSKDWITHGRSETILTLNALRTFLEADKPKAFDLATGPKAPHKLVGDGAWIDVAQRASADLNDLFGRPPAEDPYGIQWAWHRGSVVTHVATSATATKDLLIFSGLSTEDADTLIGRAIHLAEACTFSVDGVWSATAAPQGFKFGKHQQLPKSATYPDLPTYPTA